MDEEGSSARRGSQDRRTGGNLANNFGMANVDPMSLLNSDHPRTQLIVTQFNGNNFLSWSCGVKLALGAKNKLGFIEGTISKPLIDSDEYEYWKRADYMVR